MPKHLLTQYTQKLFHPASQDRARTQARPISVSPPDTQSPSRRTRAVAGLVGALFTTSSAAATAPARAADERPILVIKAPAKTFDYYKDQLATRLPALDVRAWNESLDSKERAQVRYAYVSHPEPGRLKGFPNLKLTLSAGAAVDHLLQDALYPQHVPIARITSPEAGQRAAEYMLFSVMYLHLRMDDVVRAQQHQTWLPIAPRVHALVPRPTAQQVRVGILGLGDLGQHVAQALVAAGFAVSGWSRTVKDVPNVHAYGAAGLDDMLRESQILINLLPGSQATRHLIDAQALAKLPRGAGLINAGRPSHVVMADVAAALESGQLSGAVLDVFDEEPLPKDDPTWQLFAGKALITPHMMTFSSVHARCDQLVVDIEKFEQGVGVTYPYEIASGYQEVGEPIGQAAIQAAATAPKTEQR